MEKLIPFLGIMAALAVSAAITEPSVLRTKEQLDRFSSDAAKRFLADMKGNPKYDYAKYAPAVEKLIAEIDEVKKALDGKDKAKQDAAVATYEAYRAAMLANPILDFDKILCVRRNVSNPRKKSHGRQVGFLGINAHNHWDVNRTGYKNDIVVLSNLRGKIDVKSLYRPSDNT